jgi:hypothetical protein
MRPAYSLLLEVIEARWRRREMAALVATIHITSEYAPLLAWEQVLGHAGDPVRLADAVAGTGSLWGDFTAEPRACPHSTADRSAARHALRVASGPPNGWQSYLDRQHSNTAHALGICAGYCTRRCTVVTRLSKEDQRIVDDGSRLALAIVRLRHAAPVGHGFGVPSADEVTDAWLRTRAGLARLEPAVETDDGFPLPGLPSLCTALAGLPIVPDRLLEATAAEIVAALDR